MFFLINLLIKLDFVTSVDDLKLYRFLLFQTYIHLSIFTFLQIIYTYRFVLLVVKLFV